MKQRFMPCAPMLALLFLGGVPLTASSQTLPALFSSGHLAGSNRLIGTNGLSNIEGAGGGGLATWATITGYGTNDQIGADVHSTYIHVPDFNLSSDGVAVGLYRRFEVS